MSKTEDIIPESSGGRKKRTVIVTVIFLLCFAYAVGQLIYINRIKTRDQDFMVRMEQLRPYELTAKRGAIYDSENNVLAVSVQGWNVEFNYDRAKKIRNKLYNAKKNYDAAASASERERAELAAVLEKAQVSWDDFYTLVTVQLFDDLDIEEDKAAYARMRLDELDEFFNGNPDDSAIESFPEDRSPVVLAAANVGLGVKKDVDAHIEAYDDAGEMRKNSRGKEEKYYYHYISAEPFVKYTETYKRLYNYSDIVGNIVGRTSGDDGRGLEGLEYWYNSELAGTSGRRLLRTSGSRENDAVDGTNIVTTINIYLQSVMRDILAEVKDENDADTAIGICMDCDTGAILADISLPDYDSADTETIRDPDLLKDFLENSTALEQPVTGVVDGAMATLDADFYKQYQRTNRSVTGAYELGSVIKMITVAAAIEENIYPLDKDVFTCHGTISFPGEREDPVNCWYGAHGDEDLAHLLINSCNPFAAETAHRLGRERFYNYFEAFGLTERTGVDFLGESFGNIPSRSTFINDKRYLSSLFSYSYGQSFMISPLQMVTAVSAIANGGKLLRPYFVAKTVDENGNVLSVTKPEVRRQVISENTSDILRDYLTQVVTDPDGTGTNAAVTGYNIAGKTGTAEHTEPLAEYGINSNGTYTLLEYNSVFCGFAPSDDPQIAIIFILDYPKYGHSAAQLAAPLASRFFEKALEYLGIPKTYTDMTGEYAATVPDVTGKTVSEARAIIDEAGLDIYTVGSGSSVDRQFPEGRTPVSEDGIVIVYTDDSATGMTVTPDFSGCSLSQAISLASEYKVNIQLDGNYSQSYDNVAYQQSEPAGSKVQLGSIINVYFMSNTEMNN